MKWLSLSFLFLSTLQGVIAETACHDESFVPDAILRVTAEDTTQACLPSKQVALVNGTTPGPELRIKEGITYWIRVYNDMTDSNLTMHWHGLSMAMSPFADGTPQASQWPIPPNCFFDYEMHVPIGMAGTYFYHSHVGFQAVSATGPLIVEDAGAVPYMYDEERIVFLQDTFNKTDAQVEAGLVADPLNWSGESAVILVNGLGGGTSNGIVCNGTLSTIDVEPDRTYRIRIIGATALTFASLAIEGHDTLTVIEADGSYTEPHDTSFMQVGAGQRYSFLLTTKAASDITNQTQFWIQVESRERPTVTRSYAVLNYAAPDPVVYPPPTPPLILPNTNLNFLDYELKPHSTCREEMPTAEEVTRTVTMTVHQRVDGPTIWKQNGSPWTETFPQEPYLVSLYKNDGLDFPSMERALANNGLDPVSRAFPAQIGEVLEIIIQNTGGDKGGLEAHPFHAHGAHYWDLGSGNGSYDQAANEAKLASLGVKPVLRDTTMLYRYQMTATNGTESGWRAWRLRVTQPGVWMIHCHILQHMVMGMQTLWVMGNKSEVLKVDNPDVQGYLVYGGNVVGNENSWPSPIEYFGNWTKTQ